MNDHLNIISNGLGAPSMRLFQLACEGKIPATVSITGDTGSEKHRLMNDGRMMSSYEYYQQYVEPMGRKYGIQTFFYRAKNKAKQDRLELWEHTKQMIEVGKFNNIHMPLFGSRGGRISQTCTDNWKLAAIRQCGRELGAKTMRSAIGLHKTEMWRRAEMRLPRSDFTDFPTYQTIRRVVKETVKTSGGFNFEDGIHQPTETIVTETQIIPIKWMTHYYPIGEGEFAQTREEIRRELELAKILFMITSECDSCPHKDWERWARTPVHVLKEIARYEKKMNGEFFFTEYRLPFLKALKQMKKDYLAKKAKGETDFGCQNGLCGI